MKCNFIINREIEFINSVEKAELFERFLLWFVGHCDVMFSNYPFSYDMDIESVFFDFLEENQFV